MAIPFVDNTEGAGEELKTGFDKVNQAIERLNEIDGINFNELVIGTENEVTGSILFQSEDSGLPRLRMRGYSLTDDAAIFTTSSANQNLDLLNTGSGDLNVNVGGTLTADTVIGDLVRGTTLRTDTGKFLAPTDFAFRNAGDTDYRNVAMGNVSANEGAFSSSIAISRTGLGTISGDSQNLLIASTNSDQSGSSDTIAIKTVRTDDGTEWQQAAQRIQRHIDVTKQGYIQFGNNNVDFGVGESLKYRITNAGAFQAGTTTVIDSNTDSFFRNGEYSGTLDVEGVATFYNDIYLEKGQTWDDVNSYLTTANYAGGFGGTGTQLRLEDGKWHMVADKLTVRERARFYELEIQRFRSVGGSIMVNEGMAVVSTEQVGDASWSWSDTVQIFQNPQPTPYTFMNQYRCFTEEDISMEFQEGDLVKRQQWTGRGIGVTRGTVGAIETGDIDPEVNVPARYFDLALEPGDDVPAEGMDFVRMGSISDADRMGGIQLTSSDDGAPFKRTYYGLDNWNKENTIDIIRSQDGRLDNLTIPEFSELDGTQVNMFGMLTDNFFAWKNVYISVAGGEMKLGENADGNGNAGIYQNEDNYWLPGVGAKFTAESGAVTVDNIISSINASTEGVDISGNKLQLTGDTTISGDFLVEGSNVRITGDTTFTSDVDIKGVLNAVTGTFDIVEVAPGGELSGSNWFIDETSWVHPTLGSIIYARNTIAPLNAGGEANDITGDAYQTSASTTGTGSDSNTEAKLRIQYYHKEGINTLTVSGLFRRVLSTDSTATGSATVSADIIGSSDNDTTFGSSFTSFSLSLDVSGLSSNTRHVITVDLQADVQGGGSSAPSDGHTTTSELREDVVVISST